MIRAFWQELGFGLQNPDQVYHVIIRLVAATVLGGLVGIQRESTRKPAGLRTHVLVSLATAAFIVACSSSGLSAEGVSRVIQGIITGIGFIGAGSILKVSQEHQIKGLTTAASVWMSAAIGVTVGLGALGIALMITVLAVIILSLARVERSIEDRRSHRHDHDDEHEPE